jgi:hypothetical protein
MLLDSVLNLLIDVLVTVMEEGGVWIVVFVFVIMVIQERTVTLVHLDLVDVLLSLTRLLPAS